MNKKYTLIFVTFLCMWNYCFGISNETSRKTHVNNDDILVLESTLVLPKDSYSLSSYTRYYSLDIKKSGYVLGTYMRGMGGSGIYIVEIDKLPKIKDGGCSVINVVYDLNKKILVNIYCNKNE